MKLKMMTIAVGALLLLSAVVIFNIDPYSGESKSEDSNEEIDIQYYGENGNGKMLSYNNIKKTGSKVNGEFTWDSSKMLNIAVTPMGYTNADVEKVTYQIIGASCDITANVLSITPMKILVQLQNEWSRGNLKRDCFDSD